MKSQVKYAEPRPSLLDTSLFGLRALKVEWLIYAFFLVIAGALRFWDLGGRALHHDESLHALYSWYLYTGKGYRHDPMMHGPFQFFATAFTYFLFGASDYMARIPPALFGTVLVGFPWFLRSYLGRRGALIAAALLTFSPSILYFSRFVRNDIYMALWTMIIVLCVWKYLEQRQTPYLYLLTAVWALSFSTKEIAFITGAIFGSFLLVLAGPHIWSRVKRYPSPLHPSEDMVVLLAILSLPLMAGAAKFLEGPWKFQISYQAYATIFLFLAAAATLAGLQWNRKIWGRCAIIFWGIYILLFTTFLTNVTGFATGAVGSLTYWIEQQGVQRGSQPAYYYFILLLIYEFLPLVFGVIGLIHYSIRRSLFSSFLIYWLVLSMVAYIAAGEKMPWLVVHMVLPLILLASKFLGEWLGGFKGGRWIKNLYGGYLPPLLMVGLLPALADSLVGQKIRSDPWLGVIPLAAFLILAGLTARHWIKEGLGQGFQMLGLAALTVLFLLTVRASWVASYRNGDVPVEMLVYTQSSPDIPRLLKEIERAHLRAGQDFRITIDGTSGFAWPWAWYLRDYKNVEYISMASPTAPPSGSVLIVHSSSVEKARPFLTKYDAGLRYRHRWWFPEEYRGLTFQSLARDLGDLSAWQKWWRYFMYRDLTTPLGSEDGFFFVQKDLR